LDDELEETRAKLKELRSQLNEKDLEIISIRVEFQQG
jgi:hypothetical protein